MKTALDIIGGLVGLGLLWAGLWGWTLIAYAMRTP